MYWERAGFEVFQGCRSCLPSSQFLSTPVSMIGAVTARPVWQCVIQLSPPASLPIQSSVTFTERPRITNISLKPQSCLSLATSQDNTFNEIYRLAPHSPRCLPQTTSKLYHKVRALFGTTAAAAEKTVSRTLEPLTPHPCTAQPPHHESTFRRAA